MSKLINEKYATAVIDFWHAAEDMFTYSNEPVKELYRLQSLLKFIARQANKVENLRDELALARKNKDLGAVKRIKYKAQHSAEEKAFETCWSYCAGSYDKIRQDVLSQLTNQGFIQETLSAAEILDETKSQVFELSQKELEKELAIAEAEIDL